MVKNDEVSTTQTSAKEKITFRNSENSKVVVEMEVSSEYEEIKKEILGRLNKGEFITEVGYKNGTDTLNYDGFRGSYTTIDFNFDGNTRNYICNFELDDEQKRLLIEYFKTCANIMNTELIKEYTDKEVPTLCENSIWVDYHTDIHSVMRDDHKHVLYEVYNVKMTLEK